MSKFFEPFHEEFGKKHFLLNFIGSLGIIPTVLYAGKAGNIWIVWGIFLLWWVIVVFVFLTYYYFKNK